MTIIKHIKYYTVTEPYPPTCLLNTTPLRVNHNTMILNEFPAKLYIIRQNYTQLNFDKMTGFKIEFLATHKKPSSGYEPRIKLTH